MSTIKLKNILDQILIENTEEKEYLVIYYVAKGDDDLDYDEKVKATSKEEAIAKVKKNAPRLARAFSAELVKSVKENYFSNYGQDELTAEEEETDADVTYNRGANHFINGAVEKAEQFRQQAIEQGKLTNQDEDEFPDYESLFGGEVEDTAEYDEYYEGLQENEEGLRSQLHTLIGNEMRLGKRVGMTGASHHEEEHKKAEKAVEDFLRKNPSMEEYRDKVEDHFTKLLFR